jgi:hypothetical protein
MRSAAVVSAFVLLAVIVSGGILVALVNPASSAGPAAPSTLNVGVGSIPTLNAAGVASIPYSAAGAQLGAAQNSVGGTAGQTFTIPQGATTTTVSSVTSRAVMTATVTMTAPGAIAARGSPTTNVVTPNQATPQAPPAQQAKSASNGSRSIEFLSNMTLRVSSVPSAFASAASIAYSLGGYVAFSSQSNSSALLVLRVPASSYQDATGQVQALGTLVSASSSSNDVTVMYTDLNATLQSLQTEEASLLKILGQSTNINSTLTVESRLQSVDQQINEVQSEILQTQTLISFATLSVDLQGRAVASPLSLKLTATPLSGTSPLSVTFRAVAKGGSAPYFVNYNFGDGTSSQGQALIHEFTQPGHYNVTVTATDSTANVTEAWTVVDVAAPPVSSGLGTFPAVVGGLFLHVVEGMIEIAVVALPIAFVALVALFPLRHRLGSQRQKKEP